MLITNHLISSLPFVRLYGPVMYGSDPNMFAGRVVTCLAETIADDSEYAVKSSAPMIISEILVIAWFPSCLPTCLARFPTNRWAERRGDGVLATFIGVACVLLS